MVAFVFEDTDVLDLALSLASASKNNKRIKALLERAENDCSTETARNLLQTVRMGLMFWNRE